MYIFFKNYSSFCLRGGGGGIYKDLEKKRTSKSKYFFILFRIKVLDYIEINGNQSINIGLSRSEGESGSNKTKSVEDEEGEEQKENGNGRKRVKLVSSRSPDTEVQGKIDIT